MNIFKNIINKIKNSPWLKKKEPEKQKEYLTENIQKQLSLDGYSTGGRTY